MSYAIGKLVDGQPRFFDGTYLGNCFAPRTTGAPDSARVYEERDVAEVVTRTFNALDGIRTGRPQDRWITVELPEAWL